MTTQSIQALLLLCSELEGRGIQPSVALLRAKSPAPVSLQIAIKALQHYQAGERYSDTNSTDTTETKPSTQPGAMSILVERVERLENANKTLNHRIEQLEQQIKLLT